MSTEKADQKAVKYEVIRPWFGVEKGDVVELKKVHPSLVSHVRKLSDKAAELVPATPEAGTGKQEKATKK